ncbi:hypothetical protein T10_3851 [Trichinella papuae]|uniref:Uncharacterized protein n=1 Tax=Trichinella papuae TaxID=268474 RepID=A0A0V1LY43_9BILA|nr:hypothetical protein T10_2876 [Trichinella papuae]KRZ64410.1 hypothetical protein T10_3851 [Trichinella papuae]
MWLEQRFKGVIGSVEERRVVMTMVTLSKNGAITAAVH